MRTLDYDEKDDSADDSEDEDNGDEEAAYIFAGSDLVDVLSIGEDDVLTVGLLTCGGRGSRHESNAALWC